MQITKKLVRSYLNYCRCQRQLSPKTLKAYRIDLSQFMEFMKNTDHQLSRANLNRYITDLHKRYKPKSARRKLTSLKAMCNYLVYEEILEASPFTRVRTQFREPLPLPRTIPLRTIQQLFSEAYKELLKAKPGSYQQKANLRNIAVLELLFATGMRVAELCSLKREDIDLSQGSLKVCGKGSKERVLYIGNQDAMAALRGYEEAFHKEITKTGCFFINQRKGRLSDQSVRQMIQKYAAGAGISLHITPHMFRHSFATLLLEADVDIRYIQQILGHSSITTTQIYTHVTTRKQRSILESKHPRNEFHLRV